MDEFYDLFLTGERAYNRIKFRRIVRIFTVAGAVIMLVPVFIALFGREYAIINSVFSVVGLAFEFVSVLLFYVQSVYERDLAELQNAANQTELRGGERALYHRLYLACKKTAAKRDVRRGFASFCKAFAYAALSVSVVVTSYLAVPSFVLVVACFATSGLLIASSVLQTVSDLRLRAALYEEGEKEIDEIKREKFGYDEAKIAKEAENARGVSSVPVPVLLFLKEDTERRDFRTATRKGGLAGFLYGFFLALTLMLTSSIGAAVGNYNLAMGIAFLLLLVLTVIYFAVAFPLERRKREIFERNEGKFGEGQEDALRRELQSVWIRLQRTGNIMFASFLGAAAVAGIVLGVVECIMAAETEVFASIGSWMIMCLIPAAILSFIVWIVMYAVYRKRARPTEVCLRELLRGERA